MDTSKQYIEMCKKAFEIYDGRYFIEGDFLLTKSTEHQESYIAVFTEHDCCGGDLCDGRKFNFFVSEEVECWLPRQDQLQELISKKLSWLDTPSGLIEALHKSFAWYDEYTTIETMEQFLLAFVMREIYDKQWIDNEWRKIDE